MSKILKKFKRIIFTAGGKGGVGKTVVTTAFAAYLRSRGVPVVLLDSDLENKATGSFQAYFKDAKKVDVRDERGLDGFARAVLSGAEEIVLVDMGAGQGQETFAWFEAMHEALAEEGVAFTLIVVITGDDDSSVRSLLDWGAHLRDRVDYVVVRNQRNGDQFPYLYGAEGKAFAELATPIIIDFPRIPSDIAGELANRALSIPSALEASKDIAGPELSDLTTQLRLKGLQRRIEGQIEQTISVLIPTQD